MIQNINVSNQQGDGGISTDHGLNSIILQEHFLKQQS